MKKMRFILLFLLIVFLMSSCTPINTITIHFESNGGTDVTSVTSDGQSIEAMPFAPTKEGFVFAGWFYDNDTFLILFEEEDLIDHPLNQDTTLYAKWDEAIPVQHTISFDFMYDISIDEIEVLHDTLFNSFSNPERLGYVFEGWYLDQAFSSQWNSDVDRVTESITFYAKWRALEMYEVHFISNTDTIIPSQNVSEGDFCTFSPVAREGYTLEGWYTSLDEGDTLLSKWDFDDDVVTTDLSLYANWVINSYTITLDTNGGSVLESLNLNYQSTIGNITIPTKEGHTFEGWYLDNQFNQLYNLEQMPAHNVTLYAKWYSEIETPNHHDVIRLVAYTYFYQGVQIQYDQGSGRRMVTVSPEAATSDHYLYMDCSSFVNTVYKEAFDIYVTPTTTATSASTLNYMEYARLNQNSSNEVIYYVENATITDASARTALLTSMRNDLEIGDLIVYRRSNDSAGHVMMYVGNDTFLHSTGSDYDDTNATERMEVNGTVLLLTSYDLFVNTSSSRYLFNPTFNKIAILRPMNRPNLTPTTSSLSRLRLPGIDIEKSSSVSNYTNVALGEEITYYITLKNRGTEALEGFYVTDVASPLSTMVSSTMEGEIDNATVTYWIAGLGVNETIQLEYTIMVNHDTDHVGLLIESDGGFVDDIPTNSLYAMIVGIQDQEVAQLTTTISEKINSTQYTSSIDLMKAIYQEFANDVSMTNPLASFTTLTAIYNSNMVVPMLHGGKTYNQNSAYNRDLRVRLLFLSHLCPGDMLFLYNGSTFKPYIYSGSYFISLDVPSTTVIQYANSITMNQILVGAISYTSYKIIRPLMQMS